MVRRGGKSIAFSSKNKQKSLIAFPYQPKHEKYAQKDEEQHSQQTACPKTPTVPCSAPYNKNGNWQNTNCFAVIDLPKLALVATKTYDHLRVKKEGEGSHGYNRFPQG